MPLQIQVLVDRPTRSIKDNSDGTTSALVPQDSYEFAFGSLEDFWRRPSRFNLKPMLDMINPQYYKTWGFTGAGPCKFSTFEVRSSWQNTSVTEKCQCCCRRLTACFNLLSNSKSFRLEPTLQTSSVTPDIMVSFLRHVSHQARSLLENLFGELRNFFSAQRKKQSFHQDVKFLAAHLGSLYQTISNLNQTTDTLMEDDPHINIEQKRIQRLIAATLFPGKAATLEQLCRVGAGLSSESFEAGKPIPLGPLFSVLLKISHCEQYSSTCPARGPR